jgi:Flp pilus assembly protein TadG
MRTAAADHGEDGTITLFVLGLCVAVLFLGGLSLDLWRAFSERRELAGTVDAAAVAAASALDEQAFRTDGSVVLLPSAAVAVACDHLRAHADSAEPCLGIHATPDAVVVTARREVPLTLLRVLLPGQSPLEVEVTARASPRRVP